MSTSLFSVPVAFAIFIAPFFIDGAVTSAQAAPPTTRKFVGGAYCTGFIQQCNSQQLALIKVKKGLKNVRFRFSVFGGCSSIRVQPFVNGKALAISSFLGWPGSNTGRSLSTRKYNLGRLGKGKYAFALSAEGLVGGCNGGYLGSWGGNFTFTATDVSGKPSVSPFKGVTTQQAKRVTF